VKNVFITRAKLIGIPCYQHRESKINSIVRVTVCRRMLLELYMWAEQHSCCVI